MHSVQVRLYLPFPLPLTTQPRFPIVSSKKMEGAHAASQYEGKIYDKMCFEREGFHLKQVCSAAIFVNGVA
jgi:hypothetical protein